MKVKSLIVFYLLFHFNIAFCDEIDHYIAQLKKQVSIIQKELCSKKKDFNNIDSVKKEVACLFEIDQYVIKKCSPYYKYKKVCDLVSKINANSTEELKMMLKIHGWLNISKFGKETDSQAWLLVQHADDDPRFQAAVLFFLEQLYPKGETDIKHYAYLYDRVALKHPSLGLKQKYGTQYLVKEGKVILKPYEGSIQEVETRRKEMGLEPLELYLNRAKNDLH